MRIGNLPILSTHGTLHSSLMLNLRSRFSAAAMLADYLLSKAKSARVRVTKLERVQLKLVCEKIVKGSPSEMLQGLGLIKRIVKKVELNFGDGDFEAFQEAQLTSQRQLTVDMVSNISKQLFPAYSQCIKELTKRSTLEMNGFQQRLSKTWRTPFRKLDEFQLACMIAGQDFMSELTQTMGGNRALSYKLSALFLLHARACIVAAESIALIRNGFADGSLARWRTLHELAVIANVISKNDEITAERYLGYDDIESYRSALLYSEHQARLKQEPLAVEELRLLESRKNELVKRFGSGYEKEYGWASSLFLKAAPNFRLLEEMAGVEHLRPYYKLASQQTHATAKGALFRLGLGVSGIRQGSNMLLTGPTNSGFVDPAQLTSLSLLQITAALILQEHTIDRAITCRFLGDMQDELPQVFQSVETRMKIREKNMKEKQKQR